jgi:hypothetical protein
VAVNKAQLLFRLGLGLAINYYPPNSRSQTRAVSSGQAVNQNRRMAPF